MLHPLKGKTSRIIPYRKIKYKCDLAIIGGLVDWKIEGLGDWEIAVSGWSENMVRTNSGKRKLRAARYWEIGGVGD